MSSSWWLLPCISFASACGPQIAATPPAACEAAWDTEASRQFVDGLVSATSSDRPIWGAYDLGDGSYVLQAGPSDAGETCLGLWQDGHPIAFASVPEEPVLLTPLYGYYFDAGWHGVPEAGILDRAQQPPSVRAWLEEAGVESAVVMPVVVERFPMELPAFVKVQIALHEAFHVEVQAPRWYASTDEWPVWDRQPDRAGLRACYTATGDVEAALQAEREKLLGLVTTLLDGDSANACTAGEEFLSRRAARYDMLADIQVARHDSTPGTCREVEAIMELEEGTADYASWTVMYDLGLATRERLVQQYRAVQDDVFYLTGAMQLHAVQLMHPDRMAEFVNRIVESADPAEGSLTATLDRALESYCR